MMIQAFVKVVLGSHPAVKSIFVFLESLSRKNKQGFAACFSASPLPYFFANLPGGVQVRDAKKLIEMHEEFFESSKSRFEYGEPRDGVGGDHFFTCSVPVKVTLPHGTVRQVYVDMTFFKSGETWAPGRLVNTVMESSQVAIG